MRIAIDARLYGLEHRGLGRYLVELTSALVALNLPDEFVLILDPRNREQPQNLPKNFSVEYLPARVYTLAEQVSLPRLVHRLHVDVIHIPHFSVPLRLPQPFVVTVHDLILHHFPTSRATTLPRPLYWLKLAAYHLVVATALRRSARIITPSRAVADDIASYYPRARPKISTIPLAPGRGVAPARLELPKCFALTVGAAYPHKNLERAVQAVAAAAVQVPHVTLIIVGRRDVFMEQLAAYVKQRSLQHLVRFWGEATDAELAALYQATSAYLVPSLAEGFGLGALEALRAGAPVVAADIPVLREVLGEAAFYADPSSTAAWAAALVHCSQQKIQVAAAVATTLNHYSWPETARRTMATYRAAAFAPQLKGSPSSPTLKW